MKNIFSSKKLIALTILLLLIVSCSSGNKVNNDTNQNKTSETSTTKETNKPAEPTGPGPNDPQFKITTPQEGSTVGKAEFVLELKNTEYPKFLAVYGEKNSTEIGDVFTLSLENGEHTVEIRLLDKKNTVLDTKKVKFTLLKSAEEIKREEVVQQEQKAKELVKKEETKTETPKVETPPANIETADTSEAKSLSLDFDIKFPPPGFGVKGNIVAVRLIPSASFTFGALNTTHVPGKGYFKYKLNNGNWTEEESATFTVKDLEKGTNTVYVELMRNDMTSYGIQKHVSFEGQTVTGKS
ncbi:hypothetical protein HZA97_07150 [Candidatus Woesearchaeota archaeon]|nr:hypothetical protein [Candidatus Woesearchaeota archaeon]